MDLSPKAIQMSPPLNKKGVKGQEIGSSTLFDSLKGSYG